MRPLSVSDLGSRGRKRAKSRAAVAAPITLILVTVTMFSIISIFANNSAILIQKLGHEGRFLRDRTVIIIHETIEHLFASNPGTSESMLLNMPSGEIRFTENSLVSEGLGFLELYDFHSIVKLKNNDEVVYDSTKLCLTPARIPPGLSKVTLSVGAFGAVKRIAIEVERL